MSRIIPVLLFTAFSYGQLTLSEFPKDYQLYPRDADDSAVVAVSGNVTEASHDSIAIEVFKNNVLIERIAQGLIYTNDTASFSFTPKIHAELSEHRFELYLDNQLAVQSDSVVCGDVFLLNGQSNAVASSHNVDMNAPPYKNAREWLRSFGAAGQDAAICESDTFWGLGLNQKEAVNGHCYIGVWGLKVAQLLIDSCRIPVCIIAGPVSGSHIGEHQKNTANPVDLSTIYGRLLYRSIKAGVKDQVKSMFWYQGENDGANYIPSFGLLYDAWKVDYPGIKKIYLFQVRRYNQIREDQRKISELYPDINLMVTVGAPGYGGEHFNVDGYTVMGEQLFLQVRADFYNSADTLYIRPPRLLKVYHSTPVRDQIIMQFDQPIVWPADR